MAPKIRSLPLKPRVAVLARYIVLLAVLCSAHVTQAKEITDTFGRKVSIPDRVQKVYSTSPPVTYLLYALDPQVLAGLNTPVRQWEKPFVRRSVQELPVLGGWFGEGQTPNIEAVLRLRPEIIVAWKSNMTVAMNAKVDDTAKTLPIPVISVTINTLSDYPGVFIYLGRILGREQRARELSAYAGKTLADMGKIVRTIPQAKRVSVYYAEGVDGLSTECKTSMHTELIGMAGGKNVHSCVAKNTYGMDKVSLEQVMLYNPDVILAFEPVFYEKVYSDPRWQGIRAVKGKRVYLIPNQPFNWFDRPPSFMRLLGLKWLTSLLHPQVYRPDLVKEVQHFMRLFFGISLTNDEARKMMHMS